AEDYGAIFEGERRDDVPGLCAQRLEGCRLVLVTAAPEIRGQDEREHRECHARDCRSELDADSEGLLMRCELGLMCRWAGEGSDRAHSGPGQSTWAPASHREHHEHTTFGRVTCLLEALNEGPDGHHGEGKPSLRGNGEGVHRPYNPDRKHERADLK